MVKTITTALIITLIGLSTSINAYAQQSSFDLKKASNQYNASGTVSVSKNGTQFTYSAVVKDLPSTLPANGIYYILWGLNKDGKADNLGPITNSSESRGILRNRITQFFITSEKERYPEFVSGPRVAQTDSIQESVFAGIVSPTPTPVASPIATSSTSPIPIGGPTGAPETGLGGALLLNSLIYSLGAIGVTGVGVNLYKRAKNNKVRK